MARRVPRKWIQNLNDERAVAAGCYFDERSADRVSEFAMEFCRHSQGEWAGQPFVFEPWQAVDLARPIYGWKNPQGYRRFRAVSIWFAKKNGKTSTCQVFSLYEFIANDEPGAVVAIVAVDREQGSILFDMVAASIRMSPELASVLTIVDSRKTIIHRASGSKLIVLSADVASKEGLNISALFLDELHRWPKNGMFETLRYSGAARRQPITVSISTAGTYDPTSIGWEQYSYAKGVLSGAIDDISFFAYVREADPADDWTSPDTWRKANPNWGITIREEELALECRAAQHSVSLENAFRRYRLNMWVQSTERWLPLTTFDASAGHAINEAAYVGKKFFGGIDVGSVADLSVAAYLFECPHDPSAIDVVLRAFLPAAALREGRNAALYEQWRRDGWLTVTDGDVTDENVIVATVIADALRFGCHSIAVDRLFQAMRLSQDLAGAGLEVVPCAMSTLSLAPLVTDLEKRILSKTFHHGGHPILRSAVDAVEMLLDAAGNRRPSRADRTKKIDALIASLLALDRRLRAPTVAPEPEIYFIGGRR